VAIAGHTHAACGSKRRRNACRCIACSVYRILLTSTLSARPGSNFAPAVDLWLITKSLHFVDVLEGGEGLVVTRILALVVVQIVPISESTLFLASG